MAVDRHGLYGTHRRGIVRFRLTGRGQMLRIILVIAVVIFVLYYLL
jgi:hypothetical protein